MALVGRKGKLSITENAADVHDVAWRRYEDVLTADVFGAYRYLPPSVGIAPILDAARDEIGQSFSHFIRGYGIELSSLDIARIRFWPTFKDGREPDVFVLLESTQHKQSVALLVEAKLHAAQHEIGQRSQLGHYLIQHLADTYADASIAWQLPQLPRPLLFITNHKEIPALELARARREVKDAKLPVSTEDVGLFWTNWATVGCEARRLWQENRDNVDKAPWLRHLWDLYEEIRDRDLLPRPPFIGIAGPRFSNPRFAYARSFVRSVPDRGSTSTHVYCRRYFSSTATEMSSPCSRYHRQYRFPNITGDRFPAIYSHNGAENE